MKRILLASSALSLLFPCILAGQTRPDFSGTWRMDASRSESAMQAEPIKSMTVVIKQTASDITIETTTERGKSLETYSLIQTPRGEAAKSPEKAGEKGAQPALEKATEKAARWQGEALVTEVVRDVRGQSVTAQQSRRLAASGNEMIVESIVEVQHGYTLSGAKNYGSGKDVFIRVRP
jgi:hypothetical protein